MEIGSYPATMPYQQAELVALASTHQPPQDERRQELVGSAVSHAHESFAAKGESDPGSADMQRSVETDLQSKIEHKRLEQEQLQLRQLDSRDREVRNHELAHAAAGGQYAGAPVYHFKRGPDGVSYAVSGEVPISTSREANPEASIRKAQIIRRAALAPAEPSPQDRRVAALASQMEAVARSELIEQRNAEVQNSEESGVVSGAEAVQEEEPVAKATSDKQPGIVDAAGLPHSGIQTLSSHLSSNRSFHLNIQHYLSVSSTLPSRDSTLLDELA